MFKKIALVLILGCSVIAQAQINVPAPSPLGKVVSMVGLTEITIDYNRPKVRGREIFGEGEDVVVPYGKLWRTGAADGTILTLSTEVTIAGTLLNPGKYLVLTIPDAKEWSFILYKDLDIDGANLTPNFKKEHVALETTIKPFILTSEEQSLSFQISDISDDNTTAVIEFAWGNTGFKVPLEVSFDEAVMKQIAASNFSNAGDYIKAARYYLEFDKDLEQALRWVNTYLARDGHADDFWYMYLKAQILAKMGNKKEAIAVANRTIKLAAKSKRGDLGYIKRSQAIIDSFNK